MGLETAARDRIPRQARGRRRRERFLAAAERLLRSKGFEEITIADIVREARSSVGSFYHLFETKEAIVPLLYARYDERITEHSERIFVPERWRGKDLAHRAGRLIRYAVRGYRQNRGLIRALALHARSHAQDLTKLQLGRRATLYDRATQLLLACRDEIAHADPEAAVRLGLFFVGTACRDKILFDRAPHPRSIVCEDRELASELTRAFLAYLGSSPRKRRTHHVV